MTESGSEQSDYSDLQDLPPDIYIAPDEIIQLIQHWENKQFELYESHLDDIIGQMAMTYEAASEDFFRYRDFNAENDDDKRLIILWNKIDREEIIEYMVKHASWQAFARFMPFILRHPNTLCAYFVNPEGPIDQTKLDILVNYLCDLQCSWLFPDSWLEPVIMRKLQHITENIYLKMDTFFLCTTEKTITAANYKSFNAVLKNTKRRFGARNILDIMENDNLFLMDIILSYECKLNNDYNYIDILRVLFRFQKKGKKYMQIFDKVVELCDDREMTQDEFWFCLDSLEVKFCNWAITKFGAPQLASNLYKRIINDNNVGMCRVLKQIGQIPEPGMLRNAPQNISRIFEEKKLVPSEN